MRRSFISYAIAVVVSLLVPLTYDFMHPAPVWGPAPGLLGNVVLAILVFALTLVAALLPTKLALIIAGRLNLHHPFWFALGGAIVGAILNLPFAHSGLGDALTMLGGAIGGTTYRVLVGAHDAQE